MSEQMTKFGHTNPCEPRCHAYGIGCQCSAPRENNEANITPEDRAALAAEIREMGLGLIDLLDEARSAMLDDAPSGTFVNPRPLQDLVLSVWLEERLTEAARAGRRATLDPGAFVERGREAGGYHERMERWQDRAVAAAVADLIAPLTPPAQTTPTTGEAQ